MSYEKHTWETGEVITADKLNHLEGGVEANQPGYECTEERTLLTEDSVTTTQYGAPLSYTGVLTQDELIITFDGTEYVCEKKEFDSSSTYGADMTQSGPVFTEYPFIVMSDTGRGNGIYTETLGDHTVKIEELAGVVTTTPCFEKAVNKVNTDVYVHIECTSDGTVTSADRTAKEIEDLFSSGKCVTAIVKQVSAGPPKYYTIPLKSDATLQAAGYFINSISAETTYISMVVVGTNIDYQSGDISVTIRNYDLQLANA